MKLNPVREASNGYRLKTSEYIAANAIQTPFWEFHRLCDETWKQYQNINKNTKVLTLVVGDLNAHSPSWSSPKEDKRGEVLADMIAATNLNIWNIGNEPTFIRGASRTHIDITMASENLTFHVKNWRVLDEESLSLHRYIMYELKEKSPRRVQQVCTGWQNKKLDMGKLNIAVKAESDSKQAHWQTAAAGGENYCSRLTYIADKCIPRRNDKHKK